MLADRAVACSWELASSVLVAARASAVVAASLLVLLSSPCVASSSLFVAATSLAVVASCAWAVEASLRAASRSLFVEARSPVVTPSCSFTLEVSFRAASRSSFNLDTLPSASSTRCCDTTLEGSSFATASSFATCASCAAFWADCDSICRRCSAACESSSWYLAVARSVCVRFSSCLFRSYSATTEEESEFTWKTCSCSLASSCAVRSASADFAAASCSACDKRCSTAATWSAKMDFCCSACALSCATSAFACWLLCTAARAFCFHASIDASFPSWSASTSSGSSSAVRRGSLRGVSPALRSFRVTRQVRRAIRPTAAPPMAMSCRR
mmetsp:Transcript_35216/g.82103  ORF Transcript_35216/g.82103 Transcript_35216/m.82103 type:complete len:327 (-) Transcript_35216:646-1626(-)